MHNKTKLGKKGIAEMNVLITGGISILLVAVAVAIGAGVLQNISTSNPDLTEAAMNGTFTNITQVVVLGGNLGLGGFAGQFATIGTVVGLAVILGILMVYLLGRFRGGM